jgi:hypothetical protein
VKVEGRWKEGGRKGMMEILSSFSRRFDCFKHPSPHCRIFVLILCSSTPKPKLGGVVVCDLSVHSSMSVHFVVDPN